MNDSAKLISTFDRDIKDVIFDKICAALDLITHLGIETADAHHIDDDQINPFMERHCLPKQEEV